MKDLTDLIHETNQAYKQREALKYFGENDPGYITAKLTYEILLEKLQEDYKK